MGLHDRIKGDNGDTAAHEEPTALATNPAMGESPKSDKPADPYAELKTRVHHACIAKLGPHLFTTDTSENLNERVLREVTEQLALDRTPLTREERRRIVREITDDILGYGPLEPLLRDDTVTEVMVNNFDRIFIEREGKLERSPTTFADNAHLLRIIDKIVSQVGRRIDESSPMVDARLPDGSRVNAIIPPLSLRGPTMTIRKFSRDPYTMDDLIAFGSLTPKAAQFLAACTRGKLNVLISGGTGTGKTTTLNAISAFVPGDERIVTIEDAAELQLQQDHVITLEARPPNIEGQGEIRIRELVRNSLRMRPDRIIVGEVRGAETLDMLQAMNTGHEGSLTTIHANSPRDALSRLETLVLTSGVDLPLRAIREQISSAFDLLVQITRLVDGSRRDLPHHRGAPHGVRGDHASGHLPGEASGRGHGFRRRDETALAACVHRAEAALPRQAGSARSGPSAELLRRRSVRHPVESGRCEFRRLLMINKRRLAIALAGAICLAAPAANAGVAVKGVDTGSFPALRVSVLTSDPSSRPPRLTENGLPVRVDRAENLGRTKSVVLAIDRSQSMRGAPLAHAIAAARGFLAAKPAADRLAVAAFATKPQMLTGFSSDRSDADGALRAITVDPVQGTTLYDAIVRSSHTLAAEPLEARVIIVVTDGNETRSAAALNDAIAAARKAGTAIYVVAIESPKFNPDPLRKLAEETGGAYHGTASSTTLSAEYAAIASELRRTWRLDYATSVRPGDTATLQATWNGQKSLPMKLELPSSLGPADDQEPSHLLPGVFYRSVLGTQVMAVISFFIVLLAASLALTTVKGARLKKRLAPHIVQDVAVKRKHDRERLAAAAGLFTATENAFEGWKLWKRLDRLVERSDLPIRTVELFYMMAGGAIIGGGIASLTTPSMLFTLAGFAAGGFAPVAFVWVKATRRLKAFENQFQTS